MRTASFWKPTATPLGGMVSQIKENGRLKLTNIGGMKPANAEAENVRIITKGGNVYEGVCQLVNASVHVNGNYETTERSWDTMKVLVDECKTKRGYREAGDHGR